MAEKEYGEFQTVSDRLDDIEAVNSIFHQQGYLFFRGVLDAQQVLDVKGDFVRGRERQGFVRPGETEPIWTGKSLEELDDGPLYALDYYPKLLDSDTTQRFFERLFGGPVFISTGKWAAWLWQRAPTSRSFGSMLSRMYTPTFSRAESRRESRCRA